MESALAERRTSFRARIYRADESNPSSASALLPLDVTPRDVLVNAFYADRFSALEENTNDLGCHK